MLLTYKESIHHVQTGVLLLWQLFMAFRHVVMSLDINLGYPQDNYFQCMACINTRVVPRYMYSAAKNSDFILILGYFLSA